MTFSSMDVWIWVASSALAFVALHDIVFRTVPNWISAALALLGCAVRLADHRLVQSLLCGLIVFALAACCWRRGWIGGGDVKLIGATAILVPPMLVPSYIAAVSLAGGGLALIYLVLERIVPALELRPHASLPRRILAIECRRIRRRLSLPYAAAISAAAILTLVKA